MGLCLGDYKMGQGFGTFGAAIPDDTPQGNRVLQIYDEEMKKYPAYKATLDSQLNQWSKNNVKVKAVIIDGIGFQARVSGLSDSKIREAMKSLASTQKGIVPFAYSSIGKAIGYLAANPGFFDMTSYVVTESAKDIAKGIQKTGDSIISTLNFTKFLLPAIPVVLLLALYMRTKGSTFKIPGLSK